MPVFIRFLRGTPWVAALVVAATIATATAAVIAADVYTRADSTSMRQKIERIVEAEQKVTQGRAPQGQQAPADTAREVTAPPEAQV